MIRDLHRDHGCKHRADQIQEAGDIIHGEQNGPRSADDRHRNGGLFPVQFLGEGLGGNTGRPGIQEGSGDSGEHQDHQSGNAETGLHHDNGNVILPGKDRRAHTDDIHPAGHQSVHQNADPGGLHRLFRLAGVVADEGQPTQRHGHRQLHRRTEGHGLAGGRHSAAGEEDHLAQH